MSQNMQAVRRLKLVAARMAKQVKQLDGLSRLADLFGVKGDEARALFLAGTWLLTDEAATVGDGNEALDAAITEWSIELEVWLNKQP